MRRLQRNYPFFNSIVCYLIKHCAIVIVTHFEKIEDQAFRLYKTTTGSRTEQATVLSQALTSRADLVRFVGPMEAVGAIAVPNWDRVAIGQSCFVAFALFQLPPAEVYTCHHLTSLVSGWQ